MLTSKTYRGAFAWAQILVRLVRGPKYNGKYLREVIEDFLGDTRLTQTLTNVVIPCFDIKKLQPVIFSSYQVYCIHQHRSVYVYRANNEILKAINNLIKKNLKILKTCIYANYFLNFGSGRHIFICLYIIFIGSMFQI